MQMLLDSYDWQEAFGFCGEPDTYADKIRIEGALPKKEYDLSPFTRENVTDIACYSEGENDGESWQIVGKLKDGRWFFLEAGCDYTGWD
jgi:hypothetical protein